MSGVSIVVAALTSCNRSARLPTDRRRVRLAPSARAARRPARARGRAPCDTRRRARAGLAPRRRWACRGDPRSARSGVLTTTATVRAGLRGAPLVRGLVALLGRAKVLGAHEDLLLYEYDGAVDTATPDAVVLPDTTADAPLLALTYSSSSIETIQPRPPPSLAPTTASARPPSTPGHSMGCNLPYVQTPLLERLPARRRAISAATVSLTASNLSITRRGTPR